MVSCLFSVTIMVGVFSVEYVDFIDSVLCEWTVIYVITPVLVDVCVSDVPYYK